MLQGQLNNENDEDLDDDEDEEDDDHAMDLDSDMVKIIVYYWKVSNVKKTSC